MYAKDVSPISKFVTEGEKRYKDIFQESKTLSLSLSPEKFLKRLYKIDKNKGVFLNAHWLTYLFDYQERVEYIWAHFPLFYSIANEIAEEDNPDLYQYLKKERVIGPWTGQRLSHRFHQVHKLNDMVKKTAETLSNYNGSLTKYIDETLQECSIVDNENWISLVAATLNILTYEKNNDTLSLSQYAEDKHFIIKNKNQPWKIKTGGEKRLWSALKDYLLDPYFRKLFINSISNKNRIKKYLKELDEDIIKYEIYLSQLELPGDLWNEDFFKYYFSNFKKISDNRIRKIFVTNSRMSARRLFYWLHQQDTFKTRMTSEHLYPIYLDASFTIRKNDLLFLMKHSKHIKSIIEAKIKNTNTESTVLRAYEIIRRELEPALQAQ